MELIPLNNHLLVAPEAVEDSHKVEGTNVSIVLPDQVKDAKAKRVNKGTVVSIGCEVTQVAVGDVIVGYPYAKNELEIDGKIFHLISEDDILAKIKNAKN